MRPRAALFKHRLIHVVISAIIGVSCAIIFDMRHNGIVSATVAGRPIELATLWLVGIFVADLVLHKTSHTSELTQFASESARFAGAVRSFGICLAVIAISWIAASEVLPNSARIYLMFYRQYISEHWQVDPVTKLTYLPLDFYATDDSERMVVPAHFFLLDREHRLGFDPSSHKVTWPTCPGAIYTAFRLEDQIYILRHYAVSATAPLFPCLITPIPNNGQRL